MCVAFGVAASTQREAVSRAVERSVSLNRRPSVGLTRDERMLCASRALRDALIVSLGCMLRELLRLGASAFDFPNRRTGGEYFANLASDVKRSPGLNDPGRGTFPESTCRRYDDGKPRRQALHCNAAECLLRAVRATNARHHEHVRRAHDFGNLVMRASAQKGDGFGDAERSRESAETLLEDARPHHLQHGVDRVGTVPEPRKCGEGVVVALEGDEAAHCEEGRSIGEVVASPCRLSVERWVDPKSHELGVAAKPRSNSRPSELAVADEHRLLQRRSIGSPPLPHGRACQVEAVEVRNQRDLRDRKRGGDGVVAEMGVNDIGAERGHDVAKLVHPRQGTSDQRGPKSSKSRMAQEALDQ